MRYVVPMLECERGWGCKLDGYSGPFDTRWEAVAFQDEYNAKYNNESEVPDWYIVAQDPIEFTGQKCEWGTIVA